MKEPSGKGYGILLFSGGLDSMLAAALLVRQGVRVDALRFSSVFDPAPFDAASLARRLGIPVTVMDHTEEIIGAVKNPEHGLGRHLNPCIDCRIRMLRRAEALRVERGADFVATGEVVGQRPMSQRRPALDAVEKASGLAGKLLRPLSAGLLNPTDAEIAGLVDRSGLLSISGRGRKDQIRIAAEIGLQGYQSPAGGCALTNAEFAAKARDLLCHGVLDPGTAALIRFGRHFRLDDRTRVIIGRSELDNAGLASLAREGDVLLETSDPPGPVTVVAFDRPHRADTGPDRRAVETACAWTAAYTKAGPGDEVEILVSVCGSGNPPAAAKTRPASRKDLESFRIKAL